MLKPKAFAFLAKQLVGIDASSSDIVNRMRKAVDGVASGEPWCACFVQHCARETDDFFRELGLQPESSFIQALVKTESTQALWNNAQQPQRHLQPSIGSVVVWRLKSNQALGHCGIVAEIGDDHIVTIEGNTSMPGIITSEAERNGRGVWQKRRLGGMIPGFDLLGYLQPWG